MAKKKDTTKTTATKPTVSVKKYELNESAIGCAIDTPKGRFILTVELTQSKLKYLHELGTGHVKVN